jgi:predicted nucleic-acid-binding protein
LTEDYEDFADPVEEENLLTKQGQLKYEVQVQLDNYVDHAVIIQDEIVYFMKEGTVHQPEVFEQVLKGYNIDTSDFVINTEDNIRFNEPNHNH